jgi:pimeloyl-ACP methyl ester carboxylesterase
MTIRTDMRLRATAADLPAPVAAALAAPPAGEELRVEAAGYHWRALAWGAPTDPPLLAFHGVTACAETFWRIGPALAASGRRVVAPDLPGHGLTGGWRGRHRFAETAADLAAFVRALRLDQPDLTVLGHSWGAMVAAALPAAELRPARVVLLDPPCLPLAALEAMTHDPLERPYAGLAEAAAAIRAAEPSWSDGDVEAKALGLTRFDVPAVLAVLLENGDWDGGVAALAGLVARGLAARVIRGDPAAGCYVPDAALPGLERIIGPGRVTTIAGGPHSPQRTHPEATLLAILRALAD